MHKCVNNTIGNVYHLEQWVDNFFPYSQEQLGFDKPVSIIFQSDEDNAAKMLGKTAYYDPEQLEVVLYTDGRHPKDVMRSLSHELVHHAQNCRGDFTSADSTSPGYAQEDPHLRDMEREAYERGNLIFRDFEDLIKTGKINIEIDFSDSGEPKMSLKEWKNNELNTKLMKKWGLLKEAAKPDFLDLDKDGDKEEPMKQAAKEIGSKEHNDEEGNRPSMAKDMDLKEDSEGEETYHYGEDEGEDDKELHDLVKRHATKAHIDALKRDMDYDEDHEDRRERGDHFREGMASDDVAPIKSRKYIKGPQSTSDLDPAGDARLDYEKDPSGYADDIPGLDKPGRGSKSKRRKAFAKQFKEGMFSPNHYCVHHGGVQHEGQIKMAEAISHNFDKSLNKVTWYDMKLQDGTILEQVAAEEIMVTNASLAEGHSHPMRDEDEDDLEEAEGRGKDYEGIGSKESDNMRGNRYGMKKKLATKGAPEFTGAKVPSRGSRSRGRLGGTYRPVTQETKISVREAKEITRRIIERVKQENK